MNYDYKTTFMRNTPYQIQPPKPKTLMFSAKNVLADYSQNTSYWKFDNSTHQRSLIQQQTNNNKQYAQFNMYARVLPPDILE